MATPALPFLIYASNASSSTFPSSFASCGVHILSEAVDQELLTHLREQNSTIDSFYCLVDLFKHMQDHPLLSWYLHAKGSSSIGIGNGKNDGHKKASSSTDTTTITTTMAGHTTAITFKQFGSRLLLKNFIFTLPSVESILILYLRQNRLAAQQQQTVDSSASIKDPHEVAFASLCTFLGVRLTLLTPALDNIQAIGEEEDDAGEEAEMEEEGEEEGDWIAPSRNDKSKAKKNMKMKATEEVDEEGGLVLMEIEGEEEEEGDTTGNILAPSSIIVKKKSKMIYSMPTSLRDVWILSPAVQKQFIDSIWHDETWSTSTRATYIYWLGACFRVLQTDANVCRLVVSQNSLSVSPLDHPKEQQRRQLSTLTEVCEFILQPPVKAKLLEQVQKNKKNMELIRVALHAVGLKITDLDFVVPDSASAAAKAYRRRALLSHAPSLSDDMQKFIINIFKNDTSRNKNTNTNYISFMNVLWGMLEKELTENIAFASSSGFPLLPPLATPEDVRGAFLGYASLKKCFLSLKVRSYTFTIKRIFLEAFGLRMTAGYDDIVPMASSSVDEAAMTRPRRMVTLSHAPSLSVETQKFIIDVFRNDTSRAEHTNQTYLSVMNVFWKLLEKQLAQDVAGVPSSSGFPLIPPLATHEDLRDAILSNKALKGCFLTLQKEKEKVPFAKAMLFNALGLEVARREEDGLLDIVKKKTEDGCRTLEDVGGDNGSAKSELSGSGGVGRQQEQPHQQQHQQHQQHQHPRPRPRGRPPGKKAVAEDGKGQKQAKATPKPSASRATGSKSASRATTNIVAVGGGGGGSQSARGLGRRETRQGILSLPAPLQSLHRVLVEYQSSTEYLPIQYNLVQTGLHLILQQNEHVLRFVSELLEGETPIFDMHNPFMRIDVARWYLRLIRDGVFTELAGGGGVQEG